MVSDIDHFSSVICRLSAGQLHQMQAYSYDALSIPVTNVRNFQFPPKYVVFYGECGIIDR